MAKGKFPAAFKAKGSKPAADGDADDKFIPGMKGKGASPFGKGAGSKAPPFGKKGK